MKKYLTFRKTGMKMNTSTLSEETLSKYMNPYFVETGSFRGGGISVALKCGFDKIYSVEIHEPYYSFCKQICRNNDKVKLFLGDTIDVLPKMIENINDKITFFLDGHFEPKCTVGKKKVPILEELEIIANHPIKTHTIIIDDINQIGLSNTMWPKDIILSDVLDRIKLINSDYKISYDSHFRDTKKKHKAILIAHF
jgi:hypothetical protein